MHKMGRFWPCQRRWQTAWSAPIEKSFHNAANGPNGYTLAAVEVKKEIPVKGDPPMKSVKLTVLALVAISSLLVLLAWSQGGNPPASTKESGATSGHGMTAAEQTGKGCGGSDEQQIAALAHELDQAFGKADIGWLEKHFADEFTAIHSNAKLVNKAQEIDNVKTGNTKWATVDVHDRKINVIGDTAVVVSLTSSTGTVGGNPYSADFRTTEIWVKHEGNWKMVAFQSTRVPTSQ